MLPDESQNPSAKLRLSKQQTLAFLKQLILISHKAIASLQVESRELWEQINQDGSDLSDALRSKISDKGIEIPNDVKLKDLRLSNELKQLLNKRGIKQNRSGK